MKLRKVAKNLKALVLGLEGLFTSERVEESSQEPVDPRTVEFAVLRILQEIQEASIQLPGGPSELVNFPAPEITFVFDELDKLGSRVDPGARSEESPELAEILHAERRRSIELHKLLADMKNLISSAPARFIFVGGRNLHDEWLADQSARQPLLTNIFNAELYLPSLLVDQAGRQASYLHWQVKAYLELQLKRTKQLWSRYRRKRELPSFGLPLEESLNEAFTQDLKFSTVEDPDAVYGLEDFIVRPCGPEDELPTETMAAAGGLPVYSGNRELRRDFIQFLAYRSLGNPRRLKELLATFVRPLGRFVRDPDSRESFACDHILIFGDVERARVQLIANIYRDLTRGVETRVLERDDKLVVSVVYLTDYLLKFHRRAFSWSNLERVDELVHIHRAPDLLDLMEEMVTDWSDRILHPIRNGLYDYRFRSEYMLEIKSISSRSAHEMAAFNFTLDESLALKSLYESHIKKVRAEGGPEVLTLIAGLGELHEFDQEFETARLHYETAISMIDDRFEKQLGGGILDEGSALYDVIRESADGQEKARLFLAWGVARLRLMLQVGMTFEASNNLERAQVEYRNAKSLADALLVAMLDQEGRGRFAELHEKESDGHTYRNRLHTLKHLNLLFQPVFAEAWVMEKLAGGVDTSASVTERALRELRVSLPFVREKVLRPSTSPVSVAGSSFALITAELHNKIGDLYFFKGRHPLTKEDVTAGAGCRLPGICGLPRKGTDDPGREREGYLLAAHYHYAVGLHDLRRCIAHRRKSSANKWNIWDASIPGGRWPTIAPEGWPDFVFRAVGAGLVDLADAMLGRVSLLGIARELQRKAAGRCCQPRENRRIAIEEQRRIVRLVTRWLEMDDEESQDASSGEKLTFSVGGREFRAGTLGGWLGRWRVERGRRTWWKGKDKEEWRLVAFEEYRGHTHCGRLLASLHFSLAGAKYLEKGGYLEDAGRELLRVCQTVTSYLWWGKGRQALGVWAKSMGEEGKNKIGSRAFEKASEAWDYRVLDSALWGYLADLAIYALEKADQLFRRSRASRGLAEWNEGYLIGDRIPPEALTAACSLGLAAQKFESLRSTGRFTRLRKLMDQWVGAGQVTESRFEELFSAHLKSSLIRHSYPCLNRLAALESLVLHVTLGEKSSWEAQRQDAIGWIEELLLLRARLSAPMHFTPLHTGVATGLLYLRYRATASGWASPGRWVEKLRDSDSARRGDEGFWARKERHMLRRLRRRAQTDLVASLEMCTMRRAYYRSIYDLYYLYDDFNDRMIHFGHALQMAGSELVSQLHFLVSRPDFIKARSDD